MLRKIRDKNAQSCAWYIVNLHFYIKHHLTKQRHMK